jgi:hypothetical protein
LGRSRKLPMNDEGSGFRVSRQPNINVTLLG